MLAVSESLDPSVSFESLHAILRTIANMQSRGPVEFSKTSEVVTCTYGDWWTNGNSYRDPSLSQALDATFPKAAGPAKSDEEWEDKTVSGLDWEGERGPVRATFANPETKPYTHAEGTDTHAKDTDTHAKGTDTRVQTAGRAVITSNDPASWKGCVGALAREQSYTLGTSDMSERSFDPEVDNFSDYALKARARASARATGPSTVTGNIASTSSTSSGGPTLLQYLAPCSREDGSWNSDVDDSDVQDPNACLQKGFDDARAAAGRTAFNSIAHTTSSRSSSMGSDAPEYYL